MERDWWQSCVLEKLTTEQRRNIDNNNIITITALDFAQLLNVLDGNWRKFERRHNLSREKRNYLKELQTARNRWSHKTTDEINQNPDGINHDDLYRDIDTILRFIGLFDTTKKEIINEIQLFKQSILSPPTLPSKPPVQEHSGTDEKQNEIQKVKRKLKKWAKNQHQINAKILTLFLQLERERGANITERMMMERYNNNPEFSTNFHQMKIIASRNHGKIFDVIDGDIKIWEPIKEAVEEYKRTAFPAI